YLILKSSSPFLNQWKFRSYSSHTSSEKHSSSSSHVPWAVVSALIFVPALLYITSPPSSHYKNKATNSLHEVSVPLNEKASNVQKPTSDAFPYVLIGGGTASFNAMRGIREFDPNAEILMITEEDFPPYERPPLSKELWYSGDANAHKNLTFTNWQGKETRVFYLEEKAYDSVLPGDLPTGKPGVKLMKKTKAIALHPDENSITLSTGEKVKYEKLFLGLGGSPKLYPGAPKDQPNILTFRTIDDFQKLWEQLSPNKRVAVIGGGFLGSELAVAMTNKCRVTQYFPESGILEQVLPSHLSKWITQKLTSDSLEIVPGATLKKLTPSVNNQVIVHFNHLTRPFDVVLIAIGLDPNIELAKSCNLEIDSHNQGIVVNSQFQAAHNIWCAGDNVSFYDPLFSKRRRVEHYDHAVVTGYAAGKGMVGQSSFRPPQSMFWSTLGPDFSMEAVGLVDSSLQTFTIWKADDNEKKKGIVFYSKEDKIVGALLVNLFDQIDKARLILDEGHSVKKSRELAKRFNLYEVLEEKNN
ncbi:Apoptosis-inducing factor 1, mitochondrial, partial [Coelomomyces lativittatus]